MNTPAKDRYRCNRKTFFLGTIFEPRNKNTGSDGEYIFDRGTDFSGAPEGAFTLLGPYSVEAEVPGRAGGPNFPPPPKILTKDGLREPESNVRTVSVDPRPSNPEPEFVPAGANTGPSDPDGPGGENWKPDASLVQTTTTAMTTEQMLEALKSQGFNIQAPGGLPPAPSPATETGSFADGPKAPTKGKRGKPAQQGG